MAVSLPRSPNLTSRHTSPTGLGNWRTARWAGVLVVALILLVAPVTPMARSGNSATDLEQQLAGVAVPGQSAVLANLIDQLRDSDPELAITYGERALALLDQHPDPGIRVRVLNEMAWALRLRGEYARAIALANQSIGIAEQQGDQAGLARALNNLGSVYWYMGQYEQVLDYWLRALDIRVAEQDQEGIAGSLNNIGLLYFNLDENEQAISQFEQALVISEQTGNLEYQANHLDNLGEVYGRLGRFAEAEQSYQDALAIAEPIGNLKVQTSVLVNLGTLMIQSSQLERAGGYLDRGLALAREIGSQSKQIEATQQLARLALATGDPDRALQIAGGSQFEARSMAEQELQRDHMQLLADIHQARGDHQQALAAYQRFSAINEEMLRVQRDNKLTSLQIQFESEASERQIQLLTQAAEIRGLELASARNQRVALAVGIGLLAMVILLLVLGYRLKARDNRLIQAQNQELEASRSQLQRLAVTDPLTGLLNRRALGEQVAREVTRASSQGSPFALALVDLDLFKRINDEHGHEASDQVLIEVAQRIAGAARSEDFVARWGGEEFMLLMPGLDLSRAINLAERVNVAISSKPIKCGDTTVTVSTTFGVSQYHTQVASTKEVIRAADEALYEGKRAGGGKVIAKAI